MNLRAIALCLPLVLAGCGSDSASNCGDVVGSHHCDASAICCDPECKNAFALWMGETLAASCDTVGYQCGLFEATCSCGSDHQWSCMGAITTPRDLAVPAIPDLLSPPGD